MTETMDHCMTIVFWETEVGLAAHLHVSACSGCIPPEKPKYTNLSRNEKRKRCSMSYNPQNTSNKPWHQQSKNKLKRKTTGHTQRSYKLKMISIKISAHPGYWWICLQERTRTEMYNLRLLPCIIIQSFTVICSVFMAESVQIAMQQISLQWKQNVHFSSSSNSDMKSLWHPSKMLVLEKFHQYSAFSFYGKKK